MFQLESRSNGHVFTVYAVDGRRFLVWNDTTENERWEWMDRDQFKPVQEKMQRPLTMEELRFLNEQIVWCEELNTEAKVTCLKTGWITIHYTAGRYEECCKAHGLTLYRQKPGGEHP